jgi:UDP-N-acetylglucosamine pyrophosphorylase
MHSNLQSICFYSFTPYACIFFQYFNSKASFITSVLKLDNFETKNIIVSYVALQFFLSLHHFPIDWDINVNKISHRNQIQHTSNIASEK